MWNLIAGSFISNVLFRSIAMRYCTMKRATLIESFVHAGSLGGVQLCQSCGAGLFRNGILHEKNLPSHQSARRKRDRKGDRKIVACPPQHPAAESFVPTK